MPISWLYVALTMVLKGAEQAAQFYLRNMKFMSKNLNRYKNDHKMIDINSYMDQPHTAMPSENLIARQALSLSWLTP